MQDGCLCNSLKGIDVRWSTDEKQQLENPFTAGAHYWISRD